VKLLQKNNHLVVAWGDFVKYADVVVILKGCDIFQNSIWNISWNFIVRDEEIW